MRPKFNISDYSDRKVVMHCDAKNKAEVFVTYLTERGFKWCTGKSYSSALEWQTYEERTCYSFNTGEFSHIDWYRNRDYLILEFDNFDWSDYGYRDLQGNDLLKILEGSK